MNTGRAWWDFCSYSPDMPEGLDLYIFRVERDEEYIKTLEAEIIRFNKELDAMVEALNGMRVKDQRKAELMPEQAAA
jgi:hypothetical protein